MKPNQDTPRPGRKGRSAVQTNPETEAAELAYVDVSRSRYHPFKRALDVLCTLAGLLILLLPLLLVMLIIYVDDPGPVVFRQWRVGRDGRRFRIIKFRSMRMDAPKYRASTSLDDPERYITRVGRFLRRTSLDELPQLINVLIGDMSLVGPRPLISDEQDVHDLRMRCGVYRVRPGLTGLAQIHDRDDMLPQEKVRWDLEYLRRFGLWTDVRILLATIPRIFGRRG